jgi:hypothetical protein
VFGPPNLRALTLASGSSSTFLKLGVMVPVSATSSVGWGMAADQTGSASFLIRCSSGLWILVIVLMATRA